MRLLHTSDWHLGRSFHGFDRVDAQRAFLNHLVDLVRDERVDAVLVAGDVYDRAIPSLEAVELLEDGLARLSRHATVIVSSGNHDSARRLGFASPLLERANVHLRTRLDGIDRPITLDDGRDRVDVYAIPFLEPFTTAAHLGSGESPLERSHASVLSAAVDRVRGHRAGAGAPRAVLMAHAWFTGGVASDSEVDISVGGIGQASAAMLDGFDYVALGHLHTPQALDDHVRYSGSPLHYSFSEAGRAKHSCLVEITGDRVRVTEVPVPTERPLHEVRDSLEALLTSSAYEQFRGSFLRVHLTDVPVPQQAMHRLRERFPFVADLQTVRVERGDAPSVDTLHRLGELDVCRMFLRDVRGADADPWETAQLQQAIDLARRGPLATVDAGPVACDDDEADAGDVG